MSVSTEGSQVKCLRCPTLFWMPSPPVGYCGECVDHFKNVLRTARARAKTGQNFADGKFVGVRDCPSVVRVTVGDLTGYAVCGLCGSDSLTEEYGHCPFGCGTFLECRVCGAVLDFKEDKGS